MSYTLYHICNYLKNYFHSKLYIVTLLWVAFLLVFNFHFDFEDSYIDSFFGSYVRIVLLFLVHIISYIVTCCFIQIFTNQRFLNNKNFWITICIGFSILAFDRGQHYNMDIARVISDHVHSFQYIYKSLQRWAHIITMILPMGIYYWVYLKKDDDSLLGLSNKVEVKHYLVLLVLMIPLIYMASLNTSFLKTYPNYAKAGIDLFSNYTGFSYNLLFIIYQAGYALGFFCVELFFRGFLIFALIRFLGPYVVLPMAVTYCVLHFGKPLGEAISSFFGGYLLGILTLRTKNIYGGILVHIGIAWLMELFAWLQT